MKTTCRTFISQRSAAPSYGIRCLHYFYTPLRAGLWSFCLLNIPTFLSFTHYLTSAGRTQMRRKKLPKKTVQKRVEPHNSKVLQQLKNISSYKISDKYSCMTVWGGLKVLLALTWDSLHNCSGTHLLWVTVNIPKLRWLKLGAMPLCIIHRTGACACVCVRADFQRCVPWSAGFCHVSGGDTGLFGGRQSLGASLSRAACAWVTV